VLECLRVETRSGASHQQVRVANKTRATASPSQVALANGDSFSDEDEDENEFYNDDCYQMASVCTYHNLISIKRTFCRLSRHMLIFS